MKSQSKEMTDSFFFVRSMRKIGRNPCKLKYSKQLCDDISVITEV